MLSGCGSNDPESSARTTPAPGAESTTEPARAQEPALAVGITEPNPAFLWSAQERPNLPAPFEVWRNQLSVMDPEYYRLVIDWGELQPDPDGSLVLDRPETGCMREVQPCQGWAGLREQLAALASRQQDGGWETMVVVTGTPEWAASPPHPCERADATPRARMARPEALPAYRRLVSDVLAAAAEEGAKLSWWSPWNEPNHPSTLSPQHDPCDDRDSTPAVAAYAQLAGELRAALDAAPGEQRLVIGELAGINHSGRYSTGQREFFTALPREVVCAAEVIALHAYAGGRDPVDTVWRAVRRHDCDGRPRVWITETGAGEGAGRDLARTETSDTRRLACEAMHARLREWYRDRRVGVAIQYTFREDDLFPVGLASTSLDAAFPTLALWQAWGGARSPDEPPPARVCSA